MPYISDKEYEWAIRVRPEIQSLQTQLDEAKKDDYCENCALLQVSAEKTETQLDEERRIGDWMFSHGGYPAANGFIVWNDATGTHYIQITTGDWRAAVREVMDES